VNEENEVEMELEDKQKVEQVWKLSVAIKVAFPDLNTPEDVKTFAANLIKK